MICFRDRAWLDYLYWQQTDKKILKRINVLTKDIQREPFSGLGKLEPLKHPEVCSIFLKKEDDSNIIECVAGKGFAEDIVGLATYEIGKGVTGAVARFGKEYNVNSRKELEELEINGKRIWKGEHDKIQWKDKNKDFRNLLALPLKMKQIFLQYHSQT